MEWICPDCRAPIAPEGENCHCRSCGGNYPVVEGIPLLFNRERMARYRQSRGTVQEYYRNVAQKYGQSHHVSLPGARRFLAEFETKIAPHIDGAECLLEVGAGTGFATDLLLRRRPAEGPSGPPSGRASPANSGGASRQDSQRRPSLTAADASLEMLLANKAAHPGLNGVCCATEDLPFPEESFDCIVGNNTFYLVPDKAEGAASLARVLKKGGKLIFSEMNPHHPLWPLMFTVKGRFFERTIYEIFPRQMRRRFEPLGLELAEVDFYSYAPYFAGETLCRAADLFRRAAGWSKSLRRFSAIRIFYLFIKR